jgi:hypothetical protein
MLPRKPAKRRDDDAGGLSTFAVRVLGFGEMCRCNHEFGLHDPDKCAVLGCKCAGFQKVQS